MNKNISDQHTTEAIRERLQQGKHPSYLRDFIYGAIDGAVTTFAVVASVAATGLSSGVVLILGGANLLADGFSMAAGNYLGIRAEKQMEEKARKQEEYEIEVIPEGEREEIRQIFAAKGFEGETLEAIVEVITADKKQWVDTMIVEEYGVSKTNTSAVKAAVVTYLAFIIIGAIPLLTFIIDLLFPGAIANPFTASIGLTAIAFFVVGALKSRFVSNSIFREGFETLFIGGLAAGIAYGIGLLLRPLVNGAL